MTYISKIIITLCLSLLINLSLFSQTSIDKFFDILIHNDNNISSFADEQELMRSNRLGITYTGITNKFLISYDIDEAVKKSIADNKTEYTTRILETKGDYTKVEFSVPSMNYTKIFYFKSGKYIAPSTYYDNYWKTITSKYFIFKVSEPKYFNNYCVNKLDAFVDSICVLLQVDEYERKLLEREKIYYILCKDENEIEEVSGFNTRGIFITAFDEIITTYNTHYHELAHLLINFKLKSLSLYTLPFFMEGFAVAVGGRGGMSSRVVTDIGLYLQVRGMLTYDSIITNEAFYKEDASLTYPVAGLYNMFLLKELGGKGYLNLYKRANGDLEYIRKLTASDLSLPDSQRYIEFLKSYGDRKLISFEFRNCWEVGGECGGHFELDSTYCFNVKCKTMNLYPPLVDTKLNYKSILFEKITNNDYDGASYIMSVDTSYVKVYNCYSNELIFSYDMNFSIEHIPVPTGMSPLTDLYVTPVLFYSFSLAKSIFDGKFSEMLVVPLVPDNPKK